MMFPVKIPLPTDYAQKFAVQFSTSRHSPEVDLCFGNKVVLIKQLSHLTSKAKLGCAKMKKQLCSFWPG